MIYAMRENTRSFLNILSRIGVLVCGYSHYALHLQHIPKVVLTTGYN